MTRPLAPCANRFTHAEAIQLGDALGLPRHIRLGSYWFEDQEALIILMRRMSTVTTLRQLRKELRREASELCEAFNGMVV